MFTSIQSVKEATIYDGEAPESDDEILAFSSIQLGKAHEVTEVYRPSPRRVRREPSEEMSVLQKMLGKSQSNSKFLPDFLKTNIFSVYFSFAVDRNHHFWHHLNQHMQSTVVTASSKILAAQELLIQSQLKLQAATRSIKQANETADQILIKCQDILSSDFLPDIDIPT